MIRAALAILTLSGCATTYRPAPAPAPFEFTLTLEQCAQLRKERRDYRAVEQTASYVSGAGALVATALLAVPALRDAQAAQGASAGVALVAGGVNVFSGSQVNSLDDEIGMGCR